jgi:prolyl oligopeptidase
MTKAVYMIYGAALAVSVSVAFADDIPAAPVARVESVSDTYFGETVIDRYRWMENDKDSDWLPYLKQQNAHTRGLLDALPKRDVLLGRIQQLSGDQAAPARVQKAGVRLFYQQRPAGANNFKLFVREGGKDRVLVDPTKLDTKTSHISMDWWQASPDGSKLVYGLSKDGSEDSVLQVMDVRTGTILKERIADTQDANPNWLDDSSGFFYNQLSGKNNTPERYLDSVARFHKLGADPAKDPLLMKRGLDATIVYEKIQAPYINTSLHSGTALLILADVRPEKRIYAAPLRDVVKGKANWQLVADFADDVTDVEMDGDVLYLLSTKDHPRGRLLKTSASVPSLASAAEVVAESKLVLQGMARAKDGLYLRAMDGGPSTRNAWATTAS